jgi:hypothetical protein
MDNEFLKWRSRTSPLGHESANVHFDAGEMRELQDRPRGATVQGSAIGFSKWRAVQSTTSPKKQRRSEFGQTIHDFHRAPPTAPRITMDLNDAVRHVTRTSSLVS